MVPAPRLRLQGFSAQIETTRGEQRFAPTERVFHHPKTNVRTPYSPNYKEGSVWDLQARFEREWFDAGKWQGGFGRGAKKGFIHLDLREPNQPRKWDY